MEFQTRSESTGLAVHPTLEAALDAAIADESIEHMEGKLQHCRDW